MIEGLENCTNGDSQFLTVEQGKTQELLMVVVVTVRWR